MFRYLTHLRNVATQAMANDVFDIAKAVAYSGMLMLFPALLVITTALALLPEGSRLAGEMLSLLSSASNENAYFGGRVTLADLASCCSW